MSVLLLALVGCGSFQPIAADAEVAPGLQPLSPARGAFVDAGDVAVSGQAVGLSQVTVNGAQATRSGSTYLAGVDATPGAHMVEIEGIDASGAVHRARYGFLAGEFEPADGAVAGAMKLRMGPEGLADVGPLLQTLLDPSTLLAGVGGGGPIYDDGDIAVTIAGVEVPSLAVDAIPRDGFVDLTVWMPGLHIPLDVETQLWFIDIDLDAHIRMDQAAITGKLYANSDGDGIDVSLQQVGVHVQGVELDIDGLADFFEDLIITDGQVETLLSNNLDPLERAIPGLLADMLTDLELDLSLELDLLGSTVAISPQISGLVVHPGGVDLGIDLGVDIDGRDAGPGFLKAGEPTGPEGTGVAAVLADDAVNRALYEMWDSGALDLDLPVAPGGIEATALALFGGDPAAGGAIRVTAGLPPVLVERDGQARVQLAEWQLAIDTPGGQYGDVVEVVLGADIALDLVVDADSFGARLSDATVHIEPWGASTDVLADDVAQLEETLAAGIGLANGLLSFPLADLGIEATLPPVAIARSADGRATQLDISLAGWTP